MPEALPEGGPGLAAHRHGRDPVAITAIIAALASLLPTAWLGFGGHTFGPLAIAAIIGIVAVLFGFLVVLRHPELQNQTALRLGLAAIVIGLIRVLIYPLAGW